MAGPLSFYITQDFPPKGVYPPRSRGNPLTILSTGGRIAPAACGGGGWMVHCMPGASPSMVVGSEWRMVENSLVGVSEPGAPGGGGGHPGSGGHPAHGPPLGPPGPPPNGPPPPLPLHPADLDRRDLPPHHPMDLYPPPPSTDRVRSSLPTCTLYYLLHGFLSPSLEYRIFT